MNRKIIYISLVLLAFPLSLLSQSKEIANIIATGDLEFSKRNYYGAAKIYKDALRLDNRMYNIVWKVAEASRLDNDYIEAAKYYRILSDKVSDKFPDATFYYAMMLKADEDYIRAQYFFEKYISDHGNTASELLLARSRKEIFDCEIAWKMYNSPNGYNILHGGANVNSVYSDFSSALTRKDIMLFSSIRPFEDTTKDFKSRIYFTDFNNASSEPELFDPVINIDGYDISNPHLNSSENKLYFTISDIYKGGNTYIYMSDFNQGKWTSPLKLPDKINTPGFNSTHPYLIENEDNNDILLWSSDRPGGEGGFDIYFCEILPGNNFGDVRNIGRPLFEKNLFVNFYDTTSVINTPGNEVTPYYNTHDSTLYFSSDWHQNMGGYDIFYSRGDFRKWSDVINIGYPLNSAQNELYYKIYPGKDIAFFTSNRKSALALSHQSCCNDIFYHEIEKVISPEDVEKQRIDIITSRTKLLVPITLYFHNDVPDPNSWDTVTDINYSDTYFNYLNLQDHYRKSYSRGLSKNQRLAAIDSVDNYFSYYVQENYNRLLEFTNLMKELLSSGRKVIVTIKGYTSPLNTVEYNNNLAKRRISSLVNYFDEYEDGIFRQYIESGLLNYEFVAFGKTLADDTVSDDPNDPRNSVYSPAASRERRIEIIAVSVEDIKQITN